LSFPRLYFRHSIIVKKSRGVLSFLIIFFNKFTIGASHTNS
jgi:hypothetical protein